MHFTGQWRDYQQAVLDEFDQHLTDGCMHIVAAPGSGKTVLGLELVNRIGRPAIILTPSLTIRDQWPNRLVPLFMENHPPPGMVSKDLTEPGHLTAATYQALHAVWADDNGTRFDALIEWADAHAPVTLVLDEAHHLRREWWRALDALLARLTGARIVALTATPPYDAPYAEWQRYESACGPIDFEIGIPELVRNGDLCPHQDHLIFSAPSDDALKLLGKRREAKARIYADLRADEALADALLDHPWMIEPEEHLAQILDAPERLSAILVHLAALGRPLPQPPLDLLLVNARDVPQQSERWLEVLFNALLFDFGKSSPLGSEQRKELYDRLHRHGLIEGQRVKLGETRRIVRMIAGDRAKIASIVEIARAESAACGARLRMVVLSDHIRASELPPAPEAGFKPTKLGVAPIFETLRRLDLPGEQVALLSGSLVILPCKAVQSLHELAAKRGIAATDLRALPLAHCVSHQRIEAGGSAKQALVALVTDLFTDGQVTILVGTQSLLGEGWDAPVINSLVLASNSASYMLSNQMRGRAIRIDPSRPDKVSNIWHLATLEKLPSTGALARFADRLNWGMIEEGDAITADFELLQRRFDAFACIPNDGSRDIRSGIERLALLAHASPSAANAATYARAADRQQIAADWSVSLGEAPPRAHVHPVASPTYTPRKLSWPQTIERTAISAAGVGASAGLWQLALAANGAPLATVFATVTSAATAASLPGLAKTGLLTWRNGTVEASLRSIGLVILQALQNDGMLSRSVREAAEVIGEKSLKGERTILFSGLPRPAEQAALEAVAEVLGPVQNPRYLLIRRSRLFGKGRTDYHAVPTRFGRNKQLAESFAAEWRRLVGPSELVHTRSGEGRKLLLRARASSLAAGFQRRVDRRSDWR